MSVFVPKNKWKEWRRVVVSSGGRKREMEAEKTDATEERREFCFSFCSVFVIFYF